MSELSMMGSGIYSVTHTAEMVCAERCNECEIPCDAVWEEDFNTDDSGNVETEVTCKKCNHKFNYSYEGRDVFDDADDAYDAYMDK